jgi:hypothetical protein
MRVDGRHLTLTIDGLDVQCIASSVLLDAEPTDDDLVTFTDKENGLDLTWFLAITALPDLAPGAFWSLLWETLPFTPLDYTLRPYGNDDPTADQPHLVGQCYVDRSPPVGGEAQVTWWFDTRLTCVDRPELVRP